MRILLLMAVLLALPGCGCNHTRKETFDPAEYEPFMEQGDGHLTGQALLRTAGGDVKYGAGLPVVLTPVTAYSSEWYHHHVVKGCKISEPDPAAGRYQRQTVADGDGRFEFLDIPPGDYYATCWITWMVPSWLDPTILEETGGWAHTQVTVSTERETKCVLSR